MNKYLPYQKTVVRNIFPFLCLILLTQIASAQNTYTKIADLNYANDTLISHRLDLYIPDGATAPLPVIVWIHGGGWAIGSKELMTDAYQLRYPRNGYALVSINYRLSGQAIFRHRFTIPKLRFDGFAPMPRSIISTRRVSACGEVRQTDISSHCSELPTM
jgi:Carboxylesterase family